LGPSCEPRHDQIKHTLRALSLPEAKGLIIVVNDGNYGLELDAALYLIDKILGSQFHSINSVIYLTVNLFATTPITEKPALVWIHATRTGAVAVDAQFVQRLFDGWRAYLSQKLGHPVIVVDLTDRAMIEKIRFVRGRQAIH
jgi:hypothetical protein